MLYNGPVCLLRQRWKTGLLPSSLIWKQPLGSFFHVVIIFPLFVSVVYGAEWIEKNIVFLIMYCGFARGHKKL